MAGYPEVEARHPVAAIGGTGYRAYNDGTVRSSQSQEGPPRVERHETPAIAGKL